MLTAIIPVRKNSKGLPGKNTKLLRNRPLYLHAVEQAISAGMDRIIISTDIQEIIVASHPAQVEVLSRPSELCSDTTPMAPVLVHAIESCKVAGTVVLLQATSPLRKPEHIQQACYLHTTNMFDLVMSVTKADNRVLKWGTLQENQFIPLSDPSFCFANRQSLPDVFRPNGAVYVVNAEWFLDRKSFVTEKIGTVYMDLTDSQDIDTLQDFENCEKILIQRIQEDN